MTYKFNQIPTELKNTPHWILWRQEERNGKMTKVPYQFNGEMALSNEKEHGQRFLQLLNISMKVIMTELDSCFQRMIHS